MSTSESSCAPPPEWTTVNEDELPEESRLVLSSLPREKRWAEPYLYQYQGFWHPAWKFNLVLDCQKNFQAKDSDVLVASYPKCGTTWLKSLMFATVNRHRFPPLGKNHPLLAKNSHELVPFLEFDGDPNNRIGDIVSPHRLISTHLPYVSLPKSALDSGCKIVYICRNPKDTFISLWHHMDKIKLPDTGINGFEEAFNMFCRGVSLYGPFWDHVLSYWKESLERPENVLFLKYEEIKAQPEFHVRRIAEFIGCPFSPAEEEARSGSGSGSGLGSEVVDEIVRLCCFENLSNLEVNKSGRSSIGKFNELFRKAQVGDWKNYLTPAMAARLDHITKEKFHGFGLDL
ncbi:hypothetical protein ACH5RR_030411 [Cinchona calisaya]|uniref:Sulfotransferase n=1 Tax=Cinchona calisaya TaxID=153742 RepID=A0ABD2YUI0_9GENT